MGSCQISGHAVGYCCCVQLLLLLQHAEVQHLAAQCLLHIPDHAHNVLI
jgi:hypothetical protein